MTVKMDLNLWQKLVLRITGKVYVGHQQHEGWTGSLPHYILECPVHGRFMTYPQGYSGRLECPVCRDESRRA